MRIFDDELEPIRDLMVLVEVLRSEGRNSLQADTDRGRIERIISAADWNPVGPFRCPVGYHPRTRCDRRYPTPAEAAECWRNHPHMHLWKAKR